MDEITTVVWDWNGTLLDDVELCMESINRLLREHRLPQLDHERYQRVFQFPIIEYYRNRSLLILRKCLASAMSMPSQKRAWPAASFLAAGWIRGKWCLRETACMTMKWRARPAAAVC